MEYITILVDESGKVRRGLLVCSSEGKTIFYQGAENRVPIESRASSEGCSDPVESPSPFPTRILKDLVLTENRSSQTISPEPYALLECCEVDGEMVVTKQESSQTIPIGESWYPSSKSELLQNLKYDGVATESVEPAGEGIGSIWELTTTVGFLDGNRFRWVIVTIANCPE